MTKQKSTNSNIRVIIYLLLKILQEAMCFGSPIWAKSLTKFNPKCDPSGNEIAIFSKKITKNRQAANPPTSVCDTFGLNYFAHYVSKFRQFWKPI